MIKLPLLLFLSLVFHAVVTLGLYFLSRSDPAFRPENEVAISPTEIEILEKDTGKSSGENIEKDPGRKDVLQLSRKTFRFSNDFARPFIDSARAFEDDVDSPAAKKRLDFRQLGQSFGAGGGDFKMVENGLSLQMIAREVDAMLYYPSPLALRQIRGGVNVKLFFAETGGCDWRFTEIDSAGVYFRIYILALVKKLCGLDQIKRLKLHRGRRVDLSFNFCVARNLSGFPPGSPPPRIVGNVLLFERVERMAPVEIRAGPIRIFGPYVAVDFVWLFEKWDEIMTGKDPLEEFR